MPGSGRVALLVGILAIAVAAVIGGCGGGGSGSTEEAPAKRGGTLKIASGAEPTTLLPKKLLALPEAQVINQVMQGLYYLDPQKDYEPAPLLAEKVDKSADLREWTFHLRPGVEFSDGKPLTSADVVFSIEQAKESESYANLYEGIETITAPDKLTVKMKTTGPAPALPDVLSLTVAAIVPDNYGGKSAEQFGSAPVGTGPFEVASWRKGQQLILKRNPGYWQKGLPLLDEVVYVNPSTDIGRGQQLRAGEVDVIAEPPFAQLSALESTPGIRSYKAENTFLGIILVNSRKALFADPGAREAINLAISREDITEAAWRGAGRAGASYFPLAMLYAKDIKPPAQDVARAKALLAAAVKATGEQPNFTLYVESGNEISSSATQVIQQNLEAIGMKLSIQQLDPATFYEQLGTGHYGLTFLTASSAVHDPIEWTNSINQTDQFWTAAPNGAEVTKVIEESNAAVQPKEREKLNHRAQQLVYESNNIITTSDAPIVFLGKDEVSGFATGPTGVYDLREVGLSE